MSSRGLSADLIGALPRGTSRYSATYQTVNLPIGVLTPENRCGGSELGLG
jgi:hypothetical protein